MKIKCDFCEATAYGSRDKLQMAGWMRAVFTSPRHITVSACPEHGQEWSDRVGEIFTSAKVGGTKTRCFEEEIE